MLFLISCGCAHGHRPETTLRETYAANSSTSTEPTAPTATDTKRTKGKAMFECCFIVLGGLLGCVSDETDEKTRLADAITSSFQSLRVSDASYDSRDDKPKPTCVCLCLEWLLLLHIVAS